MTKYNKLLISIYLLTVSSLLLTLTLIIKIT